MSSLSKQLLKQLRGISKVVVEEEKLQDIYQIITKIQSKNLMLVELLVFLVEKGFVKNQNKLHYFMELYDFIKGSNENESVFVNNGKQEEQEKFSCQKFIRTFKEIAKKMYPSDPLGFDNYVYKAMIATQHPEIVRMKIDDTVKKFLTRETINLLKNLERELQIIYEIYLPENFNGKMGFTWQQLKYLEKKIPIIAVFRFLWDSEICPNYITPTHFFEIVSKMVPPQSIMLAGANHKETLFYNTENIVNYAKQAVFQKKMKLIEGDIGVNFFEFCMLLIRLSMDITKQKVDFTKSLQIFIDMLNLKEVIASKGDRSAKPTKFQQKVKQYFEQSKKLGKNTLQVQKGETKKKIEQILQTDNQSSQDSVSQFLEANLKQQDLLTIKKCLDDDGLPQIPPIPTKQKQNNASYNMAQKHVIIGEQLPKLPQKNKPRVVKRPEKKDKGGRKFKPEQTAKIELSDDYFNTITQIEKKQRMNNQYPIILMEALYPSDLPSLSLLEQSQLYLQTCYIHLGERSYCDAFKSFKKAKNIHQNSKNNLTQFYFFMLEGVICQAAAKDDMALFNYHKAKQIATSSVIPDTNLMKYHAYKALAGCLYHLEQYQYSLRCFLKAKQCGAQIIQPQSIENAIIQNNIGCLFMILNRNNQAMEKFDISYHILDLQLGKFHEKTMIVQQNQSKNKKAFIQFTPEYKTMWKTFVEKPGVQSKPVKARK